MKRIIVPILLGLVVLALIGAAANKNVSKSDPRAILEKNVPGLKFDSVKESPIAGLYEVMLGNRVFYFTPDGRYMVSGDIIDHANGGVNLTTQAVMNTVAEKEMIVFSPAKPEFTLTVFTDTDCGFCRKLHQSVPELNKQGVKVRYLLYPRDDRGDFTSPGYQELQSVWCADNQQEAMNIAKAGGQVPMKKCNNPIRKHVALAQALGLQGTPLLVTGKGTVMSGYRPVEVLLEDLRAGK